MMYAYLSEIPYMCHMHSCYTKYNRDVVCQSEGLRLTQLPSQPPLISLIYQSPYCPPKRINGPFRGKTPKMTPTISTNDAGIRIISFKTYASAHVSWTRPRELIWALYAPIPSFNRVINSLRRLYYTIFGLCSGDHYLYVCLLVSFL